MSFRSDIWSLGVVLYALAYSCLPYPLDDVTMNFEELKERILHRPIASCPPLPHRPPALQVLSLSLFPLFHYQRFLRY